MAGQMPDRKAASQCQDKTDGLIYSHNSHMRSMGVEVLRLGLPPLPEQLTYQMSIPVAYWTASRSAVVLFLNYTWLEEAKEWSPSVTRGTYSREGDNWTTPKYWWGTGWSHDPIANPRSLRDLG